MTVVSSHRQAAGRWTIVLGGCLLAALAGPLVAASPSIGVGVLGLAVIIVACVFTARLPAAALVIGLSLLLAGLVDLPQQIHAGPTSGQGVESILLVALMALLCLNGYAADGVPSVARLWPLGLFVVWALASFLWGGVTQEGIQNVLIYLGFAEMLLLAATAGRWAPDITYRVMNAAFTIAALTGCALYAVSFAIAGHGNRVVVSPRPFGLFGILVVAWFMPQFISGSRRAGVLVLLTVVLTLVSLSRSALAAQLIVILFAWIGTSTNFRTVLRAFLAVMAVVVAGFAAVMLYAPLHNRFVSGDQAKVGGISLNVTGRDKLWSANWHWFTQKPEIGWGAGSSDRMTSALPGQFAAHPHNDYLRLLVDFGVIGLLLFISAYLALMMLTWRGWRAALPAGGVNAHVQAAALLALTGIAVTMVVDNPLIEIGKMVPLAAMAGVALGMSARPAEAPAYDPARAARAVAPA